MRSFDYESLPSRVIFGRGVASRIPELAADLGMRRVLVIATGSQAEVAGRVLQELGSSGSALFPGAAVHTPVEVTAEAMEVVAAVGIDGLVAIGGGSAIGLGKAVALRTDLPQIVVPTTYAGSEMTPILGQTENGQKVTLRSAKVLPEAAVYDVDLTLGLPAHVSVTSGFNAMAHAVEALYSKAANRLLMGVGEECVRAMAQSLPKIIVQTDDVEARAEAMEAGWLGGWCLANGGSALHHKLCHMLGGAFNLPHSETHTVLLPHVLAFNAKAAPEAVERLCGALDAENPALMLYDLAQSLGAPGSLKELGMPRDGIDKAVQAVLAAPMWNPAPLDPKALKLMITHAWKGDQPR